MVVPANPPTRSCPQRTSSGSAPTSPISPSIGLVYHDVLRVSRMRFVVPVVLALAAACSPAKQADRPLDEPPRPGAQPEVAGGEAVAIAPPSPANADPRAPKRKLTPDEARR